MCQRIAWQRLEGDTAGKFQVVVACGAVFIDQIPVDLGLTGGQGRCKQREQTSSTVPILALRKITREIHVWRSPIGYGA
ncbi:MAG: hypothetical protein PVH89_09570 [Gammaproteobacteria bacterium]